MEFALLKVGTDWITAVPIVRMPRESVEVLVESEGAAESYTVAKDLLFQAVSVEDVARLESLDYGDFMEVLGAFLRTQVIGGYESVELDLDLEWERLHER